MTICSCNISNYLVGIDVVNVQEAPLLIHSAPGEYSDVRQTAPTRARVQSFICFFMDLTFICIPWT